jgi:hypothetical protein
MGDAVNITLGRPSLNGDTIHLAGTNVGGEHQPDVNVEDGTNNTWNALDVDGTSASDHDYGTITLGPSHPGNVTFANGINVSYGILTLGSANGGAYIFNGNSYILNDSALIAQGGRYQSDPFIVNGTLGVSGGSTANFTTAPLEGHGTIDVVGSGTVDVGRVLAGLHMDVFKGGELIINNGMQFQGTIVEDNGGGVDVLNAGSAVREVLHQATDTLDLLNKSGATVADLKFSGDPTLYAASDGRGGMDILTLPVLHPLPITFAH